jgi:hypothetical protein
MPDICVIIWCSAEFCIQNRLTSLFILGFGKISVFVPKVLSVGMCQNVFYIKLVVK